MWQSARIMFPHVLKPEAWEAIRAAATKMPSVFRGVQKIRVYQSVKEVVLEFRSRRFTLVFEEVVELSGGSYGIPVGKHLKPVVQSCDGGLIPQEIMDHMQSLLNAFGHESQAMRLADTVTVSHTRLRATALARGAGSQADGDELSWFDRFVEEVRRLAYAMYGLDPNSGALENVLGVGFGRTDA